MRKVIDQNKLYKKFNFGSLITKQDDQQACACIKEIIDSGNYFENSPKFQTKENLFGRDEAFWLKYRMSFLFSCFMYLGKEVKVGNMMAWSFMTNTDTSENRETYWHNHAGQGVRKLSGIYYLHIPDDVKEFDTCGTEMAPNGPTGKDKVFVRPSANSWLIYPSETWHRPGINYSYDYRYIIAVDVGYYE